MAAGVAGVSRGEAGSLSPVHSGMGREEPAGLALGIDGGNAMNSTYISTKGRFEEVTGIRPDAAVFWCATSVTIAVAAASMGYNAGRTDQAEAHQEWQKHCTTLKVASPLYPAGREVLVCPMKGAENASSS